MAGVDGGNLQADSQPKSFGLVWENRMNSRNGLAMMTANIHIIII